MRRTRKEDYLLLTKDVEHIVCELQYEYGVNIIRDQECNGEYVDGTPKYYTVYKLDGHIIMRLNDCNRYKGVTGVSFSKHCFSDDKYRQLDKYLRPKKPKDLKNSKLLKTNDGMYGFKITNIMYDLKRIKTHLTEGIQNSTKEYDITNFIEEETR